MSTILWIILIHFVEIMCILGYLLIRKNRKLEQLVNSQQDHINAISIVIGDSDELIKELDQRGAFESDDEIGTFFRNIKGIQNVLNQFNK